MGRPDYRLDVEHMRELLEERLAAEGLAPLDCPGGMVSQRGGSHDRSLDAHARDRYLAWARGLLRRRDYFPRQRADASVQLRAVWRLHAQGKSNGQVARKLRVSRGVVEKALRVVTRRAPPPPVANPWRRSGREQAWKHIEAKRNERTNMAEEKGAKQTLEKWVRYSLIQTLSTHTVDVPGQRPKSQLIDVDGRPHAGGIDVRIPGAGYQIVDADGKVTFAKRSERVEGTDLIITVPWFKVDKAERVVDA